MKNSSLKAGVGVHKNLLLNYFRKKINFNFAFSLMEMMVVMLIIAVVAAATAPMISKKMTRSTGSGDSPWIFTGLQNSIAYLGGGNGSVFIGSASGPMSAGNRTAMLNIRPYDNNMGHIFFADADNNDYMELLLNPTSQIVGLTQSNAALPNGTIAIGMGQTISDTDTIAIGNGAQVDVSNSVAVGHGAKVTGAAQGVAVGQDAQATSGTAAGNGAATETGVAVGNDTTSTTGVAVGHGAITSTGIAIGDTATTVDNAQTAYGNAIAIGTGVSSLGAGGIVLGQNSSVLGQCGVAIGSNAAVASGTQLMTTARRDCIAIGTYVTAGSSTNSTTKAIAMGNSTQATGNRSIAIGNVDDLTTNDKRICGALNQDTIAIGSGADAEEQNCIAIGRHSTARWNGCIAIGYNARATASADAPDAIAIGTSQASASGAIAIGRNAVASHANSVAIGSGAVNALGPATTAANQIVLGTASDTVYIPGRLVVDSETIVNRIQGTFAFRPAARGDHGLVYLEGNNDTFSDGFGVNYRDTISSALEPGSVNLGGRTLNNSDYPSDRRLKNVGEAFTGGLEQIKKLEVFNFTYKKDEAKTPHVGVMAQDLEKIFPDAVTKGNDGFLRIRFEDMFYAVINAIKELDKKITEIAEQVKANFNTIQKLSETIEAQQKTIEAQQKTIDAQQMTLDEFEKRLTKLEKKRAKKD